jgi:hypothetical protein
LSRAENLRKKNQTRALDGPEGLSFTHAGPISFNAYVVRIPHMTRNQRDLSVPSEVLRDPKSSEVLRAWVANGGLVCSLRPEIWDDTANWGILLADIARHVANAVEELKGDAPEETLASIQDLFNRELDNPTDEPTGQFEN